MKRQGNLLSFALFGFVSQALLLALLWQWNIQASWGFLLAALCFMLYRVYIEEKKIGVEGYFQGRLRRWWIRKEPENTFSFALIGSIMLVFCNAWLWETVRLLDIWAMGFVSIGLTQIIFEQARFAVNKINAYATHKKKLQLEKKVAEVKNQYGLHENVDCSRS